MSNASVGAGVAKPVVLSGGTTTVPTNATTILMTVTAKGAKAGTMTFYPLGNPSGGTSVEVAWAAGGSDTAVVTTDIGQKNSVAFKNSSAGAATVTATITGYSTEVELDDISSQGGSTGQVLTDDGDGATWQDPQLPSAFYTRNQTYTPLNSVDYLSLASLTLPAGKYAVDAAVSGYSPTGGFGYFGCYVAGPGGGVVSQRFGNVSVDIRNATLAMDGFVSTTGATVKINCLLAGGTVWAYEATIMATRVGATTGPVVTRQIRPQRTAGQPGS